MNKHRGSSFDEYFKECQNNALDEKLEEMDTRYSDKHHYSKTDVLRAFRAGAVWAIHKEYSDTNPPETAKLGKLVAAVSDDSPGEGE